MSIRTLLALGLVLTACADASQETIEIEVAAAASLAGAFAEIASSFEAQHPSIEITLNVAASSQLREQVLAESGQDVFASASADIMEEVESAGALDGSATVFARNRLALAVPATNPAGIDDLADLTEPSFLVGLCAMTVPCGALARDLLDSRNVNASVDTHEPNALALRTKLEEGELDVALLYVSDVFDNELLRAIEMVPPVTGANDYPIGVIAGSAHATQARLFVDFVLSPQGQETLSKYGFLSP